jgi:hypothetical protein
LVLLVRPLLIRLSLQEGVVCWQVQRPAVYSCWPWRCDKLFVAEELTLQHQRLLRGREPLSSLAGEL